MPETVLRACNLCEAGCGLKFEVEDGRILAVRPDDEDPISRGFVCPKGIAIADVHADPDRLHRPLRRDGSGFREISWDEAFEMVASRLKDIRRRYGPDAVALYIGNPVVHNHGAAMIVGAFTEALGTRNRTSASTQDTAPRFAASYYLYGNVWAVPVPDVDRTDFFLCIGANPAVSQGSFLTAPDMKARLRDLRARGGKVVTVDPRRTETSRLADEHVFIRPGGDAALLLAMTRVLLDEGRVDRGSIAALASGWEEVERRLEAFAPERVGAVTGIDAATIRRLALEFAAARSAVAYTRVGTCNNQYGTVATWAGDLLNIAAGRLGRAGGALFAEPALDVARMAHLVGMNGHARWRSRVRGLPEIACDLPASVLAEEIETPGQGQVRALVTFAGNPVLSTPNGRRLDAALDRLDFFAAIDLYVNETTRHADVILPPSWTLAEDHIEPIAANSALRNHVRWSPAVVPQREGEMADWQILLRLTEMLGGGPTGAKWVDRALRLTGWRWSPTRAADLFLRLGPHGDKFLPWSKGLNARKVQAAPHGIDLGPLRSGVAHRIFHRDGRIHLVAPPIFEAVDELAASLETPPNGALLLIGRRDLRTNNSWMHNVPSLVSGRERCVLLVHPADAERAGLRDSEPAILESRVFSGAVPVCVTDEIMPGVVSLPHGWGHGAVAQWQSVAGAHAGVSANDWTDDQLVERVVGQSVLNGVPVRLRPAGTGPFAH